MLRSSWPVEIFQQYYGMLLVRTVCRGAYASRPQTRPAPCCYFTCCPAVLRDAGPYRKINLVFFVAYYDLWDRIATLLSLLHAATPYGLVYSSYGFDQMTVTR